MHAEKAAAGAQLQPQASGVPSAAATKVRSARGIKYAAVIRHAFSGPNAHHASPPRASPSSLHCCKTSLGLLSLHRSVLEQTGVRGATSAHPLCFSGNGENDGGSQTLAAIAVAEADQKGTGSAVFDAPSAEKLAVCWQLVGYMAQAAQAIVRPPPHHLANIAPYVNKEGRLRIALLGGAMRHLGDQQAKKLREHVGNGLEEAQRGGKRGLEYDAAARVRLDGCDGAFELVQLTDAAPVPLWQVVYWCLRCDDLAAAVNVMEKAKMQQPPRSWERLLELARILLHWRNTGETREIALAVQRAQEEYWMHCGAMGEHQRTIYSVLAAPEPTAELHGRDGLLSSRHVTIEDWLWHRLSITLSQMQVATSLADNEGGGLVASVSDALQLLQTTIYETYGEDYFNRNKQNPLLFVSVMLHSQQFERALAFLYTMPRFQEEAIHFGLALQHEGLLATVATPETGADGMLLHSDSSPRLCFSAMLSRYVRSCELPRGSTPGMPVDLETTCQSHPDRKTHSNRHRRPHAPSRAPTRPTPPRSER